MKVLMTLIFTMIMSTFVFAGSENYVSTTLAVKDESSLAEASIIIRPNDEVETGSSIILTFKNAKVFSQGMIDGTELDHTDVAYKTGGYQYNYNRKTWSGEGFYDVMPSLDTDKLPYRIKRMSGNEIEVELCNLPSKWADRMLTDLNGNGGKPHYEIPVVAYADTDNEAAYVTCKINANGTSISGGEVFRSNIRTGSQEKIKLASTTTTVKTETQTETTTSKTEGSVSKFNVSVPIGRDFIYINNEETPIDTPAYIQESSSSTMVPLRAVAAALSGSGKNADNSEAVKWNSDEKKITVYYNNREIVFLVGSDRIYIDGTATKMENGVVTEIRNGRAFVPFRALGGALGVDVEWEPEEKIASFIG